MAVHYAREDIRLHAIAPGLIRTPMSQRAQSDPGILARLPELQPLTGDFGRPEDVAGAALYLATAPFVTGTVLVVDGAWTAKLAVTSGSTCEERTWSGPSCRTIRSRRAARRRPAARQFPKR